MIGKSCYHEYEKEEFAFEIIGESVDENGEETYICKLLPQYQDKLANKYKPFELRKCLFGLKKGDNCIYVIEKEHIEQLSLF